MITIKYVTNREEMKEAEAASAKSIWDRIFSALILGSLGILFLHEPIRLFRGWPLFWKYWPANLMLLSLGLGLVWLASGLVGLRWLLLLSTKPFASHEVRFMGNMITITTSRKKQTLRLRPDLEWTETKSFFLLPVHGSKSRLPIPKRAFTQEQLKSLRNDSSLPDDTARFTIHFLLTEEDFDYAKNATAPWIATGKGHIAARVVCGTSGLFFLLAPNLGVFTDVRGGWAGLWEASPAVAFGLATFCVLQIWMGLGAAGLKSLERHLNHYNEPRTYTFSDASITLKCGGRIRQKKWMNLLRFQETPNAFILYAQVFERVVIPKLALRGHDVDAFRDFLSSKLPCS